MKGLLLGLAVWGVMLVQTGCQSAAERRTFVVKGVGVINRIDPELDALVPADSVIELVADGFVFTEGPVWQSEGHGYLLFSDIPGNRIYKYAESKGITTFRDIVFPGRYAAGQFVGSNGLTVDSQGRLIVCEHGNRRIARTERDGSVNTLVDRFQGKRLNSPNDAVYRRNGDLYFTDPPYGLAKEDADPAKELEFNGVYCLRGSGRLDLIIKDLTRPNGLAFSPDESTLYIANSDPGRKVWMAYDVKGDGTVGKGRVFYDVTSETADGGPDGMKVDAAGNLYCAGPGGLWVFSPQGKHLGTIAPPETPANCNWGGADRKTLYITARKGLYRVRASVPGNSRDLPGSPAPHGRIEVEHGKPVELARGASQPGR